MAKGNLQYAVLGVVAGREDGLHGYQLKSELDVLCDDFWEVNFGRIYRALDELERNGDVLAERHEQSDRPNRKVYRITERGLQTLDDWLLLPLSDSPQPLRDELSLKLLFLRDRDRDAVAEMITRQRSIYLTRVARVAKRRTRLEKNGFDMKITALVIEGAEMRIRAELAWLDHIERSVVRGT